VRRFPKRRTAGLSPVVPSEYTVMTQSSAEKIANVVMGAAVIGAAYYVLKTPRLRRLAWQLTVAAATGTVPAWVAQQIRSSWEASAAPPPSEASRAAPRPRAV
jgi:hypothetical protein